MNLIQHEDDHITIPYNEHPVPTHSQEEVKKQKVAILWMELLKERMKKSHALSLIFHTKNTY